LPGPAWLNSHFLSSIRLTGTFCAGRYTRPVWGLKDMGCQLCAP
jgi:hypothetical protein